MCYPTTRHLSNLCKCITLQLIQKQRSDCLSLSVSLCLSVFLTVSLSLHDSFMTFVYVVHRCTTTLQLTTRQLSDLCTCSTLLHDIHLNFVITTRHPFDLCICITLLDDNKNKLATCFLRMNCNPASTLFKQ